MHPCDWSLLPSTLSDAFTCVSVAHILIHALKYFRKAQPRSAAHSSTSTASTGLLCQCLSHPSQLLAFLGGCQLKPCSQKHERKPTLVVTQVCMCSCGKVSKEQCPLIPTDLPVVLGTDVQLAWCISC